MNWWMNHGDEKVNDGEIFTNDQVSEILGMNNDEDMSIDDWSEIQVCAGTWKRVDDATWTFESDPEWNDILFEIEDKKRY